MQHIPVYQTILDSDGRKNIVFEEPETLILEPGKYYFAIRFVEFIGNGSLECQGYFKSAYERSDEFKMPLSLGLKVIGTEYSRQVYETKTNHIVINIPLDSRDTGSSGDETDS